MYLWAKTKAALTHLHHHHPQYHWYLKADDDTYVVVENLRYFLKDRNPEEPVYYGVKFKKHVKQVRLSQILKPSNVYQLLRLVYQFL